jgi:RNA polymerase sigma-54 factor
MKQNLSLQQKQTLALKQSVKLTQQLQQAVKVLQAGQTQLLEMLEQEALENPVLEVSSDSGEVEPDSYASESEAESGKEEIISYIQEFQKYFQENQDGTWNDFQSHSGFDSEEGSFEDWVAGEESLSEVLEQQLVLVTEPGLERRIGNYIISSLDKNGYLSDSTQKIADSLLVEEELVEAVLNKIQGFEPVGIAARDLRECLLVQYMNRSWNKPLVKIIILNHLSDVAGNRLKDIQKATGAGYHEIEAALATIRSLNPRPAAGYKVEVSTAEIVKPDLFVTIEEGKLIITLNDMFTPRVNVNNYYEEKIKNAEGLNKEELLYLKKKLESALWFRQCLQKRAETIYEVAKAIFEIQIDFFYHGVRGLKPLTLADIASRVDRHEATVSRVINGKYAHTPCGLFELKFFFSGGLKSDDGELISSISIKEIIQEAISEEDPRKPLSDQILCDLLRARGIEIARRTVAKYREGLGIPSSSRRKKYT